MIKRRARGRRGCRHRRAATRSGATGITAYLSNGGTLEHAQQIAGHASPKTTKLLRPDGGHGDGRRDRAHRDLRRGRPPGRKGKEGVLQTAARPCRKRSFATHVARLRPRLEDRRLPVAGPAARRPAGGRRRRRGQPPPRLSPPASATTRPGLDRLAASCSASSRRWPRSSAMAARSRSVASTASRCSCRAV